MSSMNPNSNVIPGMRRATEQEHTRIVEAWGADYDRSKQVKTGNGYRIIGFLLCAMTAVNLMSANISAALITGVVSVAAFLIGNSLAKKAKEKMNRIRRLEDGRYWVASATATKVWTTSGSKNALRGFCEVRLNDGRLLPDPCTIPKAEAKRLRSSYIKSCPILLIQLEGEDALIALPI